MNFDLKDVRFVDMPWVLQADHPAVMVYPRARPALPMRHERLYGLGVDAYRLLELMLLGELHQGLPLDGVTGQIDLMGRTFHRNAMPAVFEKGRAVLPSMPNAVSPFEVTPASETQDVAPQTEEETH